MKRFLCIKDIRESGTFVRLFEAGTIYNEAGIDFKSLFSLDITAIIDVFGDPSYFDKKMLSEYFKEMEPIHESYDDLDSEEYALMLPPSASLAKGCAIAAAIIITLGFIIYLTITWNS